MFIEIRFANFVSLCSEKEFAGTLLESLVSGISLKLEM